MAYLRCSASTYLFPVLAFAALCFVSRVACAVSSCLVRQVGKRPASKVLTTPIHPSAPRKPSPHVYVRALPPSHFFSCSPPSANQIPSAEAESIMGDHPLLPPIQDTFSKGDAEGHASAIGRRFPALCKLLATLVTASPPKSQDAADVSFVLLFARRLRMIVALGESPQNICARYACRTAAARNGNGLSSQVPGGYMDTWPGCCRRSSSPAKQPRSQPSQANVWPRGPKATFNTLCRRILPPGFGLRTRRQLEWG